MFHCRGKDEHQYCLSSSVRIIWTQVTHRLHTVLHAATKLITSAWLKSACQ